MNKIWQFDTLHTVHPNVCTCGADAGFAMTHLLAHWLFQLTKLLPLVVYCIIHVMFFRSVIFST